MLRLSSILVIEYYNSGLGNKKDLNMVTEKAMTLKSVFLCLK